MKKSIIVIVMLLLCGCNNKCMVTLEKNSPFDTIITIDERAQETGVILRLYQLLNNKWHLIDQNAVVYNKDNKINIRLYEEGESYYLQYAYWDLNSIEDEYKKIKLNVDNSNGSRHDSFILKEEIEFNKEYPMKVYLWNIGENEISYKEINSYNVYNAAYGYYFSIELVK